ncbi:SRPBCC family protein [Paracraurococcus lichenis]|uniref:SRPBCC family protein n=1 Tax=Paracraurococcus lichenis TaxID=3064888 RepID=A0ABT9DY62_9PROT|nr:SRPBCC family protein [Paracraurococcus sp. LOR1-02]MDO9708839.1 SRPBCC family protein [Paracraurococcus sp. LOR1-02]
MPEIAEQTRIAAPLAVVWPLLSDPATVAGCIPGATLAPDQGDGLWRGSVKVRFGPTIAVFKGEATLDFDHAAHACAIEGRGIDGRGASRALASGQVRASAEGEATLLDVAGSFTVTGPLETFANAGGVHVARALLAEFAANMAKLVAERAPAAAPEPAVEAAPAAAPSTPPAPPPPAVPPAELGGFGLMWRAFLSWLRSLFVQGKA